MVHHQRRTVEIPSPEFQPEDEDMPVWVIPETLEYFLSYDEYLQRLDFYAQPDFSCDVTNLKDVSYFTARECETSESLGMLDRFPEVLKGHVLEIVQFSQITRLDLLADEVFAYLRHRFFVNELLTYKKPGLRESVKVVAVDNDKYGVQNLYGGTTFWVTTKDLVRSRSLVNKPSIRVFIKHAARRRYYRNAPWIVRPEYVKRFNLRTDPPPHIKKLWQQLDIGPEQEFEWHEDGEMVLNSPTSTAEPSNPPSGVSSANISRQETPANLDSPIMKTFYPPESPNRHTEPHRTNIASTVETGEIKLKAPTPSARVFAASNVTGRSRNAALQAQLEEPSDFADDDLMGLMKHAGGVKLADYITERKIEHPWPQWHEDPRLAELVPHRKVGTLFEIWLCTQLYRDFLQLEPELLLTFDAFVDGLRSPKLSSEVEKLHCCLLSTLVDVDSSELLVALPAKSAPLSTKRPYKKLGRIPNKKRVKEESEEEMDDENGDENEEHGEENGDENGEENSNHSESEENSDSDEASSEESEDAEDNSWPARIGRREFADGQWQNIVADMLDQLLYVEHWHADSYAALQVLRPPDEPHTPISAASNYELLNLPLRVHILRVFLHLLYQSRVFRNFLDNLFDEQSKYRNRGLARDLRQLREDLRGAEKALATERAHEIEYLRPKKTHKSEISEKIRNGESAESIIVEQEARIAELQAQVAEKSEEFSKNSRELARLDGQRVQLLGQDRFFNRYWYMDGTGVATLDPELKPKLKAPYAMGRLCVQGPGSYDLEYYLNSEKYVNELVGFRKTVFDRYETQRLGLLKARHDRLSIQQSRSHSTKPRGASTRGKASKQATPVTILPAPSTDSRDGKGIDNATPKPLNIEVLTPAKSKPLFASQRSVKSEPLSLTEPVTTNVRHAAPTLPDSATAHEPVVNAMDVDPTPKIAQPNSSATTTESTIEVAPQNETSGARPTEKSEFSPDTVEPQPVVTTEANVSADVSTMDVDSDKLVDQKSTTSTTEPKNTENENAEKPIENSQTNAKNTGADNTDANNTDANNTDANNTDANNTDANNTDAKNTDASPVDVSVTQTTNIEGPNTEAFKPAVSTTKALDTEALTKSSIEETNHQPLIAETKPETKEDHEAGPLSADKQEPNTSEADNSSSESVSKPDSTIGNEPAKVPNAPSIAELGEAGEAGRSLTSSSSTPAPTGCMPAPAFGNHEPTVPFGQPVSQMNGLSSTEPSPGLFNLAAASPATTNFSPAPGVSPLSTPTFRPDFVPQLEQRIVEINYHVSTIEHNLQYAPIVAKLVMERQEIEKYLTTLQSPNLSAAAAQLDLKSQASPQPPNFVDDLARATDNKARANTLQTDAFARCLPPYRLSTRMKRLYERQRQELEDLQAREIKMLENRHRGQMEILDRQRESKEGRAQMRSTHNYELNALRSRHREQMATFTAKEEAERKKEAEHDAAMRRLFAEEAEIRKRNVNINVPVSRRHEIPLSQLMPQQMLHHSIPAQHPASVPVTEPKPVDPLPPRQLTNQFRQQLPGKSPNLPSQPQPQPQFPPQPFTPQQLPPQQLPPQQLPPQQLPPQQLPPQQLPPQQLPPQQLSQQLSQQPLPPQQLPPQSMPQQLPPQPYGQMMPQYMPGMYPPDPNRGFQWVVQQTMYGPMMVAVPVMPQFPPMMGQYNSPYNAPPSGYMPPVYPPNPFVPNSQYMPPNPPGTPSSVPAIIPPPPQSMIPGANLPAPNMPAPGLPVQNSQTPPPSSSNGRGESRILPKPLPPTSAGSSVPPPVLPRQELLANPAPEIVIDLTDGDADRKPPLLSRPVSSPSIPPPVEPSRNHKLVPPAAVSRDSTVEPVSEPNSRANTEPFPDSVPEKSVPMPESTTNLENLREHDEVYKPVDLMAMFEQKNEILSESQWRFYDTPEELDQLMTYLTALGNRERKLLAALRQFEPEIKECMLSRLEALKLSD